LLLHDFDKAGFSIAGTLKHDPRRYEFQNSIDVVDLGLGLADVESMGLESEYQHHPKARKSALIANLQENGASEEEIAFMFRDFDGRRKCSTHTSSPMATIPVRQWPATPLCAGSTRDTACSSQGPRR
jgi:hypothetical protein